MNDQRNAENDILERLRADATALAAPFGLSFRRIGKTRRDARIYGCCDTDGNIRIRLRSRADGAFLKYSGLIATLCHELAHLRHFDHGREFTRLYRALLEQARQAAIYRPAGSGTKAPPVVARAIGSALAAKAPRRRPVRSARRGESARSPRRRS